MIGEVKRLILQRAIVLRLAFLLRCTLEVIRIQMMLANTTVDNVETITRTLRVLLVQHDTVGPSPLFICLQRNGFDVVATPSVKQAIVLLTTAEFGALVCDLHLPAPGDGFTLINAMRQFHPDAVTMIMSSFPALKESMSALLPQADEILVTPIPSEDVVTLLKNRLRHPHRKQATAFEPVAAVLQRCSSRTIAEWLTRVNGNSNLMKTALTDRERTGHLPTLLNDLVRRLQTPHVEEGKASVSQAAVAHGKVRREQGYSADMLVEESRILQVCIFKTLRSNLSVLDLSLVLTDVMTIADEVDSQLRQTMASFSEVAGRLHTA